MKDFLIKIRAMFEGQGVLKQVEQSLESAKQKAGQLTEALKFGGAIDVGKRIVDSLLRIPEALKKAVDQGLEFNRMMQNSQIGIAGGFRSVDPSLSFAEAKEKGGEALDSLKQKSLELGINFEALIDTFKVNVPIMWQAGIRDTQKMIDMITLLNQVAAAKGIDGFQAQRDIIDIMNGMGQRTILGKELEANGVSNESIKAAREAGNLYELITTKLAAYGEAGKAASETQTAALERLHTAWSSLMGTVTKPWFNQVTEGLNAITDAANKNDNVSFGEKIGLGIRGAIEDLKTLKEAITSFPVPKWMADAFARGQAVGRFVSTPVRWAAKSYVQTGRDAVGADQPGSASAQADPTDDHWADPLNAAYAQAQFRKKDLSDAIGSAEHPAALSQQLSDTKAWTLDASRSDEEYASGKKKILELIKKIAEEDKKTSEENKNNLTQQKELELEIQIKEAKAAGNDALKDKLIWQQDYNRLLEKAYQIGEANPEAWARRGANASVDASPVSKARDLDADARRSFPVSEMAKLGMAMGESRQAAGHVDVLREILRKTVTKDDVKAIVTGEIFKVEEQKGGYL